MKIALNFREDRVAALIVAKYPIQLDETIVDYAIKGHCFAVLQ